MWDGTAGVRLLDSSTASRASQALCMDGSLVMTALYMTHCMTCHVSSLVPIYVLGTLAKQPRFIYGHTTALPVKHWIC